MIEINQTTYITMDDFPGILLRGQHASLHLTFNDEHACNYETAAEYFASEPQQDTGWISPEEREKAIAGNSVWTLQWYPDTPIGSHVLRASTAAAVLAAAAKGVSE